MKTILILMLLLTFLSGCSLTVNTRMSDLIKGEDGKCYVVFMSDRNRPKVVEVDCPEQR